MIKYCKLVILGALISLGLSAPLRAGSIEIAPFYGYRFGGHLSDAETGKSVSVDPSASVGAALSVKLPSETDFLELIYSHQETELSGDIQNMDIKTRIDEWHLGINREFPYEDNDEVKPFLTGLLGVTDIEFSDNIEPVQLFSLGMGGGFKYFPRENIGFRIDFRGYFTIVDGDGAVAVSGGTAVVHFSGSSFIQGEITPSLVIRF